VVWTFRRKEWEVYGVFMVPTPTITSDILAFGQLGHVFAAIAF